MQIDGKGGAISMKLLFVDFAAVNDRDTMQSLVDYYNTRGAERDDKVLSAGGGILQPREVSPNSSIAISTSSGCAAPISRICRLARVVMST